MRVAFVLGSFPNLSETFILDQITGLLDRGHDIRILADRPAPGPVHPDIDRYRLMERVHYRDPAPRGVIPRLVAGAWMLAHGPGSTFATRLRTLEPRYARSILSLRQMSFAFPSLRSRTFDAILCHYGPLGILATELRHSGALEGPIATVFHGYDLSRLIKQNGAGIYGRLFRSGEQFLPVSHRWAARLEELGCNPGCISVHHMGVSTRSLAMQPRALSAGEELHLISVARLVEKKGLPIAVEAVARARRTGLRLRYTIVGDGPLRPAIERSIADHGVGDRVRLVGWKTRDAVHQLLGRAHVLVLPSITASDGDEEGIPVACMEAMASGMPVLATRHSGLPELIDDGLSGRLVSEGSSEELAAAISEMAAAPTRLIEMGRAARAKVETEFDIDRLNDRLATLLGNLSPERLA